VDSATDWIDAYSRSINRARLRTGVRVYCGVAAEIRGIDGSLDLPAALPGVEQLSVMTRRFILPSGLASTGQVRHLIDAGRLSRHDVLEQLVTGYVNALRHAGERAQAVLARPFSLLPEAGLSEADLGDDLLGALADGCRAAGAMVEVNERLACPSPRVTRWLVGAGVRLVAATDAYRARDIGRWDYARSVASVLPADPADEQRDAG
jgi:putative hydrolase